MALVTQLTTGQIVTLTVGAAAINQGRFVSYGSGKLAQTAVGKVPHGVSNCFPDVTNDYAIAADCSVIQNGIVKMEASAAISIGDRIGSAADGKAVTAGAAEVAFGIALEAASGVGKYFAMLYPFTDNPLAASDIAFTDLSDTPAALVADEYIVTNAGGTALESTTVAWTDLSDTPSTITPDKTVEGNAGGTALEFSA